MLITLIETVHVYCVHMLKYHTELHYYVQLIHAYQKIKEKRNNCDKTSQYYTKSCIYKT